MGNKNRHERSLILILGLTRALFRVFKNKKCAIFLNRPTIHGVSKLRHFECRALKILPGVKRKLLKNSTASPYTKNSEFVIFK